MRVPHPTIHRVILCEYVDKAPDHPQDGDNLQSFEVHLGHLENPSVSISSGGAEPPPKLGHFAIDDAFQASHETDLA